MKSCKKGFTVVEIVIALVIIAIVSLTATSLVLTSQSIQKNSRDKFFAVNLCNNSIAIFQSAAAESADLKGTYDSFATKLHYLLEIDLSDPEDSTDTTAEIYFDGSFKQVDFDDDGVRFVCSLSFTNDGNTVFFEIQVRSSGGKELCSSSYLTAPGGLL